MRRLFLLLGLCILAGCGGGSSGPPIINFPFNGSRTGTWSGRETDIVSRASGVMNLTIQANGVISGTWQIDNGALWTISGNLVTLDGVQPLVISDKFAVGLTFDSPGQAELKSEPGATMEANLSTDHLNGSAVMTNVNIPMSQRHDLSFAFDLVRQ